MGSTFTGQIADRNDADYYRISLAAPGILTVSMLTAEDGRITSLGTLYDGAGNQIVTAYYSNSSADAQSYDFGIAAAGDYYLDVHSWYVTGGYSVTASFAAGGATFETANNDTRDTATVAAVGSPIYAGLQASADQDWFRIDLPQGGGSTISVAVSSGDSTAVGSMYGGVELQLFDAAGTLLGGKLYWANEPLVVEAGSTGTVYARITSTMPTMDWFNAEQYRIDITTSTPGVARETEGNNTAATADALTIGSPIRGQIASATDQDWFAFQLSGSGVVTLSTSQAIEEYLGSTEAQRISVVDSTGYLLGSGTGYNSTSVNFQVPTAGTYYARIEHSPSSAARGGEYVLTSSFTPGPTNLEIESNDTAATATSMPLWSLRTGWISSATDQDWFSFDVAQTSLVRFTLSRDPGTSGTYNFTVVDAAGNDYGTFLSGSYSAIDIGRLTPGTYFAIVSAGWDQSSSTPDNRYSLASINMISAEAVNGIASSAAPEDPIFADAWYLGTARGINVQPAWADYTGAGIDIRLYAETIGAVADLSTNYSLADSISAYTGNPLTGAEYVSAFATNLARLAVAERDGQGTVGAAYNASIASINTYSPPSTPLTALQLMNIAYGEAAQADILVGGPGAASNLSETVNPSEVAVYDAARAALAATGRGGLGTIVVTPAGEGRQGGFDTNSGWATGDRHNVVVGSIDNAGIVNEDSAYGNSILVVAPGGTNTRPLLSTGGLPAGGTSEAAALTAGVVALILEANPNLGWRDVQDILANSARLTDSQNTSWDVNGAKDWNGGGHHYSWDYGFGLVDAHAAVRLAESWAPGSRTSANELSVTASASPHLGIPDASETGVTSSLNLSGLAVEWVEIELTVRHFYFSDLVLTLTSPSGTVSIPMAFFEGNTYWADPETRTLRLSIADFRGENAAGSWTLGVYDLVSQDTGVLESWTIRAYGGAVSADNTYIYTDEYGAWAAADASRRSLGDANGGRDVVNVAALSTAARIDLAGGASLIAGQALAIAAGAIEDAYGGDGGDTLIGNALANKLQGARGDDTLTGGSGADTLLGGAGNDWLDGGLGDLIDGGEGFDFVSFRSVAGRVGITQLGGGVTQVTFADNSVMQVLNFEGFDAAGGISTAGSAGADQFTGGEGDDVIALGAGDDYLAGAGGNDTLLGGDGLDWLWAGLGDDELRGGAEKDNLSGEGGNDVVFGDAGNDRITGRDGNDSISAGDGDDWVGVWNDWGEDPARNYFPESGNDEINGDAGNDVLSAGLGTDTVHGGIGNDYLAGEQDDDLLFGGEGFDWLWAGAGQDTLDGGAEKDNLNGESGNDLILAGDGNDRICGQQDDDEIHAGNGNDWVGVWNDWGEDPALNYFPEGGNDLIFGDAGNDVLSAGFGRDTVHGGADNDYVAGEQDDDQLFGNDGIDWLWGGSGADSLDGGAGDDHLIGESGADRLTGGDGADIFEFRSISHSGHRILDFDATEGDRIDVSELLNEQSYAGADPFADGRLSRVQSGADVLFRFDGTLLATIENTTVIQLQNSFFIV